MIVDLITVIASGAVFLAVLAIVVGVVDAVQAPAWRQIAADRRDRWEQRQLQMQGAPEPDPGDE